MIRSAARTAREAHRGLGLKARASPASQSAGSGNCAPPKSFPHRPAPLHPGSTRPAGRPAASLPCAAWRRPPARGIRTLRSDCNTRPSPGWNDTSIEVISSPGSCVSTSSSRTGRPTCGGCCMRNLSATGVVEGTGLTALTRSASAAVAAAAASAVRSEPAFAWECAACSARAWSAPRPQPLPSAAAASATNQRAIFVRSMRPAI